MLHPSITATASDPILADDDQLQRLFARLDPQEPPEALLPESLPTLEYT
jgi:hypothetical protein